jgi:hypothetical protein
MFSKTVSGILDEDLIRLFQARIGNNWVYENLESLHNEPLSTYSEREDFPNHDRSTPISEQMIEYRLRKLDEASGMFRALASSLRAQS